MKEPSIMTPGLQPHPLQPKAAIHVLFACTHNSARSILAQALLQHHNDGRFVAHSAGSSPRENQQPHPLAIAVLQAARVSTEGLYSKNWHAFSAEGAPVLSAVITLCDSAAGEACPIFFAPPGTPQPSRAHWGYADPSAEAAALQQAAFERSLRAIERRVLALVAQTEHSLSPPNLTATLNQLTAVV